MSVESGFRRLLDFWATLDRERLGALRDLAAPDVRFSDPFHDVTGVDAVIGALDRMWDLADEPRFEIRHAALDGRTGLVAWTLRFRDRRGRAGSIEGMSEIALDGAGRLVAHRDHWDAASQVYARAPLLGPVLRAARRRIAGR